MLAAIQSEEAPVAVRRGTGLDRLDCDVRIGAVDTRVVICYHRKIIGPRGQPLNDIGGRWRASEMDSLAWSAAACCGVRGLTRKFRERCSLWVIALLSPG